jgi:hypothetical protein
MGRSYDMKKHEIQDMLDEFDDDLEVLINGKQNFEVVQIPGEKTVNIINISPIDPN